MRTSRLSFLAAAALSTMVLTGCTTAGEPVPAAAGLLNDNSWSTSWVMERLGTIPATDDTLAVLYFNDAVALGESLSRSDRPVPPGAPLWLTLQTAPATCDRAWMQTFNRTLDVEVMEKVAEPGRRFEVMIPTDGVTLSACRGGWVGDLGDQAIRAQVGGVVGKELRSTWFGQSGDDLLAVDHPGRTDLGDSFANGTPAAASLAQDPQVLTMFGHLDKAAWVVMGHRLYRHDQVTADPPPSEPTFIGVGWFPNEADDLGTTTFVTLYDTPDDAAAVEAWLVDHLAADTLKTFDGAVVEVVDSAVITRVPDQHSYRFNLATTGYSRYPALAQPPN